MKKDKFSVPAHYFCGLMGEAIYVVVRANRLREESLSMQRDGDDTHLPTIMLGDAGLFARYAFLLACNAFENCAFAILVNSGKLSSSLTEDIDRLNTLNKFEVFALIHGKTVDRGDDRYAKVKQVIRCRNEFVHPKGLSVEIHSEPEKAAARQSGGREYPIAFDFVEVDQVILMIGDILRFVAWVVFDVCQFTPSDGATLINGDIKWWITDFYTAQELWNFDLRSLGIFEDVKAIELPSAPNRRLGSRRRIRARRNSGGRRAKR